MIEYTSRNFKIHLFLKSRKIFHKDFSMKGVCRTPMKKIYYYFILFERSAPPQTRWRTEVNSGEIKPLASF